MNDSQRNRIWVAMSRYEHYQKYDGSVVFNLTDIDRCIEVGTALGLELPKCKTCLDDIVVYMGKLHELYTRK